MISVLHLPMLHMVSVHTELLLVLAWSSYNCLLVVITNRFPSCCCFCISSCAPSTRWYAAVLMPSHNNQVTACQLKTVLKHFYPLSCSTRFVHVVSLPHVSGKLIQRVDSNCGLTDTGVPKSHGRCSGADGEPQQAGMCQDQPGRETG